MRTVASFLRDERGSYTIEFLLWIPVFLVFLAATVDASLLYLTHNAMWNAARDTARRVTTGELTTQQEVYDHLTRSSLLGNNNYYIVPPDMGGTNGEIRIAIEANIADASAFGIFGWVGYWFGAYSPGEREGGNILGHALTAEVVMRLEPALT